MAVNDIFSIVLHATDSAASVKFVNTFHYVQITGGGDIDLPQAINSFGNDVVEPLKACVANTWTGVKVVMTGLFGAQAGQQSIFDFAPGVHGTGGATAEDFAYALLINRKSNLIGRKNRGRIFLGPVADSVFSANGAVVAAPDGLEDLMAGMALNIVDEAGIGAAPVLYPGAGPTYAVCEHISYSLRAGIRRHRRVAA